MNEDNQQSRCVNCLFFDNRTGFCRKNPPQVVINNDGFYVSVFPRIALPLLDFCFEYKSMSDKMIVD